MDKQEIVKEWLEFANRDLESAIYLLNMKPMPYEIICYHCQQSAEKFLKSVMAHNDEEIIRTHDLIQLNKICAKYNKEFIKILEQCIELNDYGVQARYPYHVIDLEETDVKNAIESANIIKEFVEKKI